MSLVVSAPGKVLIAGGYLVLDPKYSGIVVSTSSRFYTIVRKHTDGQSLIRVQSPQFINAEWEATASIGDNGLVLLKDIDSAKALSKNKFVFLAIHKVLQLVLEMKGNATLETSLPRGLSIVIVGDNDFYSQRAQLASRGLSPTLDSLGKLPPFALTNVTLGDVHKTGLGSSAALITSLVTALLVHFSVISPDSLISDENSEGRALAHNVSQYVHCLAQGKVGSGFDVSSAIFGSHVYTRFDPAVIEALMRDTDRPLSLLPVLSHSNLQWDHTVQPFRLPPRMRMMLADVDAGSDTPSLVGKVLQWRRTMSSEATKIWDELSALNGELASVLTMLTEQHAKDPSAYNVVVDAVSKSTSSEWEALCTTDAHTLVANTLIQTRTTAENIRGYMRQMGALSGVPIEPQEQTRLLDACMAQAGVVAGGVPGAGGYDAIWLLVIEPQSITDINPVRNVENVWSSWKELDVSPLSAVESRERGVRLEQLDAIPGLLGMMD